MGIAYDTDFELSLKSPSQDSVSIPYHCVHENIQIKRRGMSLCLLCTFRYIWLDVSKINKLYIFWLLFLWFTVWGYNVAVQELYLKKEVLSTGFILQMISHPIVKLLCLPYLLLWSWERLFHGQRRKVGHFLHGNFAVFLAECSRVSGYCCLYLPQQLMLSLNYYKFLYEYSCFICMHYLLRKSHPHCASPKVIFVYHLAHLDS